MRLYTYIRDHRQVERGRQIRFMFAGLLRSDVRRNILRPQVRGLPHAYPLHAVRFGYDEVELVTHRS